MTVQDKLDIRARLKTKGVTLSHEQTTTITNWCEEQIWKHKKESQESKIATRLIYLVIFAIIMTHAWFNSSVMFFLIVLTLFIYNFLHFLANYVFYHNNFRDSKQKMDI